MVVLITGASSGIGRQLVLHYSRHGHKVAALARRASKLAELHQEVRGGSLRTYQADVTDRGRMQQVFTQVEQELGPLDVVIANAGIADQRLTADLDLDRFEQVFATNVLGVAYTLAPAIAAMKNRRSGQIVAISSLAALQTIPRMSTYGAAKAAINHQLEGLYWDLQPHGVHVTTICPGFIDTELLSGHGVPRYWQMDLDKAVGKIVKAIARKRRCCYFPLWLHWLLSTLSIMPDWVKNLAFHLVERLFPRPPTVSKALSSHENLLSQQ